MDSSPVGSLSAYELQRLENIKRNQRVLRELAIEPLGSNIQPKRIEKKRKREPRPPTAPTRRSSRQRGPAPSLFQDEQAADVEREAGQKRENAIVSRGLPIEEAVLDQKEKKAYRLLKTHRTKLARDESDAAGERVQTYKICHNRTLVEMIRLRPRNKCELEEVWGMASARIAKYGASWLAEVALCEKQALLREGPRPLLDVPLASEDSEDEAMEEEQEQHQNEMSVEAVVEAKMRTERAISAVKTTSGHDAHNAGVRSNPKGFKGVYKAQGSGSRTRWRAQIVRPQYTGPDPRKYLGTFDTMELAARAYDVAAREYGMPCNFDDA